MVDIEVGRMGRFSKMLGDIFERQKSIFQVE